MRTKLSKERNPPSLRKKILLLLCFGLIFFTTVTVVLIRSIIPSILGVNPEGENLRDLHRIALVLVSLITMALFLLYIWVNRIFLNPMENLIRDIHRITSANRLPVKRYALFREIKILSSSINDVLEKVSQSTMSTNVFRSIFNGLDAFLFVSDIETDKILFINESMKRAYKLDDRTIGQPCWQVLQQGQNGKCSFCPILKLEKKSGEVKVWEEFNPLTGRYYENTSTLIEWNDYTFAHLQHSVDISNLKIAEQELIAAKELAEQSNAAKTNFLARMSHEMRTPLNAITGMTAIARQNIGDMEKVKYCLPKINEASIHLLGLITDILDMSKIEAGQLELINHEFEFQKMIHHVVEMMTFRLDEKQHRFELSIDKAIPKTIIADEKRLSQILTNLLSNAIKFTPDSGLVGLRVTQISRQGEICSLRFEVSDTGIGIAPEQQDKLFILFEQGDGKLSRKFGGAGLGLVICKSLVELMGGDIWVESEPGKGSAFIFEIAIQNGEAEISEAAIWMTAAPVPSPYAYSGEAQGASSEKTRAEGTSTENIFKNKNILLVEDVEINREIAVALLEDTAVTIDCAENGIEALRIFRENPEKYHCILMDIHMPEMDGFEATRRIRALDMGNAKTIPIVAMTANVFQEDIEKCLEAGMNDHLGKPIDMDEVLRKLRKYMGE
ncbi:MAG: response regulator [Treponema sp.]|nr:response regulator [Treponema sp.]